MRFTFAELLAGHRRRAGLSQADLAEQVKIARNTIANWEAGKHLPRPRDRPTVERLATALDLSDAERAEFLSTWLVSIRSSDRGEQHGPPSIAGTIDRADKVAQLVERLAKQRILALTGIVGVGKTTLAAQIASYTARTRPVFWHQCIAADGFEPLAIELARFLAERGHAEPLQLVEQRQQSYARGPSLGVVFHELMRALRGASYLICLDDVHLIGSHDLAKDFIRQLRQSRDRHQVDLLVTARQIPTGIRRQEVEPLDGLSQDEARELLASRDVALGAELFRKLYERTAGNPQFLSVATELLRDAADQGGAIDHIVKADEIQDLLHEVYDQLEPAQQQTMRALAALLEYGGAPDVLEEMLGGQGVEQELYHLQARHLVGNIGDDAAPLYRQHDLVRNFCYALMGPAESGPLHRRAAAFYETRDSNPFRAVLHSIYAGDHQHAAELVSGDIWPLVQDGHGGALHALLSERLNTQFLSDDLQVKVAVARGQVATLAGFSREARAAYQRALDALGHRDATPALRAWQARVCRGLAETWEFEVPQQALDWVDRGLLFLDGVASPERALLLLRKGSALITAERGAEARAVLAESLRLLPKEARGARAQALGSLGRLAAMSADFVGARDYFCQALPLFQKTGNLWGELGVRENLARIDEIHLGRWDRAEREYLELRDLNERRLRSLNRRITIELSLGILRTNQGKHAEALDHLQSCLRSVEDHRQDEYLAAVHSSLADLYLRWKEPADRLARARQHLERARAIASARPDDERDQLPEICRGWALYYLARAETTPALAAARKALRVARDLDDPVEQGKSLRVLGQVQDRAGRGKSAQRSFGASLGLLYARDVYEAARAQAAWGALLRRTEAERDRGQALIAQARATFEDLGAAGDLEEAI